MWRRWIIRGLFLGLLLLWVVGWAVSTGYEAGVDYCFRNGFELGCGIARGDVTFSWSQFIGPPVSPSVDGWHAEAAPTEFQFVDLSVRSYRPQFSLDRCLFGLGFGYLHNAAADSDSWGSEVFIPFWFLILISSALLFFVWRKTRPSKPGGAFPVEVVIPK